MDVEQKPEQRSEHRRDDRPRDSREARRVDARQQAPRAVHNPFAIAFKEVGVTPDAPVAQPAPQVPKPHPTPSIPPQRQPQQSMREPVSDAKAQLREAVQKVKQVDEDTLRNVLGV
jgi:hypothetical protein